MGVTNKCGIVGKLQRSTFFCDKKIEIKSIRVEENRKRKCLNLKKKITSYEETYISRLEIGFSGQIYTFFSVKHFTSGNIKGFSGQIHYYIQGVTRRYCNSENVCGIRFIAVITVIKVNDRVCI